MNRTVKGATLKRFHGEIMGQPHTHVQTFLRASDLAKRLKRLHGLTSYGFICAEWRKNLSIHPRPHAPSSGTIVASCFSSCFTGQSAEPH